MVTPIVEGFSISHAQILDGIQSFLEATLAQASADQYDVYGVDDASLSPKVDNFENKGDDTVLSKWNWLDQAELKIRAGYLSFPLIANLTGQAISSSGSGATQIFGLDLWHEDSMNTPPKPMILRMPSKDMDGVVRVLTIGLYKVQFDPMTLDGPKYKEGLKVNYDGAALMSSKDEKGVVFPDGKKRVGRLISHT